MFKSVLVVCVGNICRSPMGEFLFKDKLQDAVEPVAVSSAGIGALRGHGADKMALEVMAENGIDATAHCARQLNADLLKENELILVMEAWQKREIEKLYPFARGRVHLLGKWGEGDIDDPYKKSKEHFLKAFDKINQSCLQWCQKLW